MENFYIRQKNILSEDDIDFLMSESNKMKFERSGVISYTKSKNQLVDENNDRTSTQVMFSDQDFPDVCNSLINLGLKLDLCDNWQELKCREPISLLRYEVGGKFRRHQDIIRPMNNRSRYFSASILVYESPDLEGGDLLLYDREMKPHKMDLEVGESVLFNSFVFHEVTEVKQGCRLALIIWISK